MLQATALFHNPSAMHQAKGNSSLPRGAPVGLAVALCRYHYIAPRLHAASGIMQNMVKKVWVPGLRPLAARLGFCIVAAPNEKVQQAVRQPLGRFRNSGCARPGSVRSHCLKPKKACKYTSYRPFVLELAVGGGVDRPILP